MSPIPLKPLGKNGPLVPQLGLGLMGLSAFYGAPLPDAERFKLLDRALERGCTFWDSAEAYGDSESLLSRWFARTGARSSIFLSTKFFGQVTGGVGGGGFVLRSDPEWVRKSCEKSLKTLGVDCIDLFYAHRVDFKTPIEVTVRAMVELKEEGKIRYLGLCEVSSRTLRRAHRVHPIAAVQVEYSPFTLDVESEEAGLLETCRELGVALVAYSPLCRGVLGGKFEDTKNFDPTDLRPHQPRFSNENLPKNLAIVEKLKEIARRKQCTVSQLALAWLMAQGDDIFPIPGTRKVEYLDENVGSVDVHLTADEVTVIRKALEAAPVQGHRYPEALRLQLFADTPEEK